MLDRLQVDKVREREAVCSEKALDDPFYVFITVIQTEASRRRREAEVQQAMENGLGSCMYVCMYVYLYVFHIYLTIYSAY